MTTQTKTLTQVIDGLREWERQHRPHDQGSRLPLFRFDVIEGQGGALVPLGEGVNLPALQLSDHALGQLLERVGFPKKVYKRLPDKLNLLNINWLIQNGAYDAGVMLRMIDDTVVRAVMSSRFEVFDNLELLTLLEPFCGDNGVVRWDFNDDLTLHISVSFPNLQEEIKEGDVVERGIHISNSEVGIRSVTIAGYTHVLKCRNGLIGTGDNGGYFRFRHTGDHDKMRDMVQSAVESTMLEAQKITAKMKAAIDERIEQPFEFIEQTGRDRNMTQEEFKSVLDSFMEWGGGNSLYDVSQAFAAAAQKQESGERSYEFQRTAVDVLP